MAEPVAWRFCQTASLLPLSHSKNLNNSQSNVVSFPLSVEAQAQVSLNGSVPRQKGAFRGKRNRLLEKDTLVPLSTLNYPPLQCLQA